MLNRSASLAMSTSILKALPGKLDIKRHSPSILYVQDKNIGKKSKELKPTHSLAGVYLMRPLLLLIAR